MDRLSSGSGRHLDFASGHQRRSYDSLHSLPEPRELRPSSELGSLQLQTEKNRLKLEEVETVVNTVHKRLEDTRSGLEDVRLKLGTFELEHRFFHTLRSASLKDEVPRNGSSSDGTDSPGLAAVGSTDSTQAISTSQLEAAMSSSRLEAIEAACQDLRQNIQEVTSVPEATERLLKTELRQVVEHLQEELQLERTRAEQHAVDILRVEKSGAELRHRLEDAERMIREVQQDHASESLSTRSRLEVAIRECDEQVCVAGELQTLLKAELRQEVSHLTSELQQERSKVAQNTMCLSRAEVAGVELSQRMEVSDLRMRDLQQVIEGQSAETSALRVRLEAAVRECSEQVGRSDELQASFRDEQDRRATEASALDARVSSIEKAVESSIRAEVKEELARVWDELERSKVQLRDARGSSGAAAADAALLQRVEALDAAMAEVRQHHLDGSSALSCRIEEAADMQKSKLSDVEELTSRLAEETATLRLRMEAFEQQQAEAPGPQAAEEAPVSQAAEEAASSSGATGPAGSPPATSRRPSLDSTAASATVDELRAALTATCSDVATLARNLATVREEHDAAITSIGGLTEFVARAAATSIHRTEELALQREEYERVSSSLSIRTPSGSAEASEGLGPKSKDREEGAVELDCSESSGPGRLDAAAEAAAAAGARVEAAAAELRAEASAQAAAAEVRVAAVEQLLGADLKRIGGMLATCVEQLEATQTDVRGLQPRVVALEESARHAAPASPTMTTLPATPCAGARPLESRGSLQKAASRREITPPPLGKTPSFAGAATPARQECLGSPLPVRGREAHVMGSPCSTTRWVEDPPAQLLLRTNESTRDVLAARMLAQALQSPKPTQSPLQVGRAPESAAGLKEKLEGIVSSVHHVLGALNLNELRPPQQVVQYMVRSPSQGGLIPPGQAAVTSPSQGGRSPARSASIPALLTQTVMQREPSVKALIQHEPSVRTVGRPMAAAGAQSPPAAAARQTVTVSGTQSPAAPCGRQTLPTQARTMASSASERCLRQEQPQAAGGAGGGASPGVPGAAAGGQPCEQSPARETGRATLPQQAAAAPSAAGACGSAALPSQRPGAAGAAGGSAALPSQRHPPHEQSQQLSRRQTSQKRLGAEPGSVHAPGQPSSARAALGGHGAKTFSQGLHLGAAPPVVRPGLAPARQGSGSVGAAGHTPSHSPSSARSAAVHLQGVSPAMMGVLTQRDGTGSPVHSNRSSLNSKRSGGGTSGSGVGSGTGGFATPGQPGGRPR